MAKTSIDETLIKACRNNERQAQRRLYELTLPTLTFLAGRYLSALGAFKDVLQETYLSIFQHLNQFDPYRASFQTWAGRIAINACLKRNRAAGRAATEAMADQHGECPDDQRSPLDRLTDEELLTWLKRMPDDYYLVFNLAAVEGYDHGEIASILGIKPALSRQRLARARAWLKREIDSRPDSPLRISKRWRPDAFIAPITLAIQLAVGL